ncbi:hypothetical protein [Gordonia sp. UBA6683]|uniref:hypothetical protein n=1 Tax=Gordonia sp. UBA6683 TaxID=1946577 RepID=UPI0025B9EDD3|nr:hypothetical protein [Gordonia sp. UBA6683]
MPLKQNWTDRDTVTATFLNQLASAVNSAVASLAGKYTKPAGGIPASDLAGNVLDKTTADTIYAPIDKTLLGWANAGSYSLVTATRNTAGGLTGGTVKWPDGATGNLTTTLSTDPASLNAVNGFVVTHVLGGTTTTFTQPTMTRDATTGAVTAQPELVVS